MPPAKPRLVVLKGSERSHSPETHRLGDADAHQTLTLILVLRPGRPVPAPDDRYWSMPPHERPAEMRPALDEVPSASEDDAQKVIKFVEESGLSLLEANLARRLIEVSGEVAAINAAFGVNLGHHEGPGQPAYLGHEGPIHLPADIVDLVQAVFGLDGRRAAFRGSGPGVAIAKIMPPQVAELYEFPAIPSSIASQTIGIFEFGGGYVTDASGAATDANLFMLNQTPPLPDVKMFNPPVSILGATNAPGSAASPSGGDSEVILDIDVAAAVAVGATIAVYFIPFDETGWIKAITTASVPGAGQPKPSVISISWNAPEASFSASQLSTMSSYFAAASTKAHDPLTFLVCSMDDGTNGGVSDGAAHVWWPAVDPFVTAVGGTTIGNVSGSSFAEITWNDNGVTSGGISSVKDSSGNLVFPLPPWQAGANVPPSINDGKTRGRGIPDIAGYANGYVIEIFGANAGSWWGTSEAAPFYAGYFAILNATLGFNVGYLNPLLYALAEAPGYDIFHDIDDNGSNAFTFTRKPPNPPTTITTPGYRSIKGWDACTGWGSIHGTRLLAAMAGLPILATSAPNGGAFGDSCAGAFVDLTLTINNSGFGLLSITDITSSSPEFLSPAVSIYPLILGVGDSTDVVIRFEPTEPGAKSAVIEIFSNAPGSPHSVSVSGNAGAPRLDIAIAGKGEFSPTCLGAHVDEPFVLSNGGTCMLQVTGISCSSTEFQVAELVSLPLSIAPGASLALPIRFAPTRLGTAAAMLTVASNDPAGPRTIEISGSSPHGRLSVGGSAIFGAVCFKERKQRTLWISNTGSCTLKVDSVELRFAHPALRLINNPFPAILRPGSALAVAIEYHAIEEEPRAHELVIHSDDPDAPVRFVGVVATTTCCRDKRSCLETKSCCEPQQRTCGCKEVKDEA